MKYLSVLVFALLLSWTWGLIHSEQRISFETHAGIQEKLAQLIQSTILSKKPEATNIVIEKIWTEPQDGNKVVAHFSYSFQEPDTNGKLLTNHIQGQGILEQQTDNGSGLDRWNLTQIKTTSDAVVFEDGLLITPGEDNEPESTLTTQPDPNAPAEAQTSTPGSTQTPLTAPSAATPGTPGAAAPKATPATKPAPAAPATSATPATSAPTESKE